MPWRDEEIFDRAPEGGYDFHESLRRRALLYDQGAFDPEGDDLDGTMEHGPFEHMAPRGPQDISARIRRR